MSTEAFIYVRSLRLGLPARKLILQTLADRADEAFSCFPGVPLIAAECELKPRIVQRHLAWFREHGYVSDRERFRPDGSQTSNRYFIHGPWDDYGGTGVPFEQVAYPDYHAMDGAFRIGTKAAGGVYSSTSPQRTGVHPRGAPAYTPGVHPDTPVGASEDVPRSALEDVPGMHPSAPLEPQDEPPVETPPPPPVGTAEERAGARAGEEQIGAASPHGLSPAAAGGPDGASPTGGPVEGNDAPEKIQPRHVAMARDVVARLPRWLQPGDVDERYRVTLAIADRIADGYPPGVLVQELSGNPPDQVGDKPAFINYRLKRMAPWVPTTRPGSDTAAVDEIRSREAVRADDDQQRRGAAAARAAMRKRQDGAHEA